MSARPVRAHTVYPPVGGCCQPPTLEVGSDSRGRTFTELGLSDLEIRSLAGALKFHHPETYETELKRISDIRAWWLA